MCQSPNQVTVHVDGKPLEQILKEADIAKAIRSLKSKRKFEIVVTGPVTDRK